MSWEKLFEMKEVKKKTKCSGCNKEKSNPCQTVSDATKCDELKKKTNASTDKTPK